MGMHDMMLVRRRTVSNFFLVAVDDGWGRQVHAALSPQMRDQREGRAVKCTTELKQWQSTVDPLILR